MMPPDTGNMTASSAYTSPITITISPATAKDTIAAGPTICDTYRAPNSQPHPMIASTLVNSRPVRPTSLRSPYPTARSPCRGTVVEDTIAAPSAARTARRAATRDQTKDARPS